MGRESEVKRNRNFIRLRRKTSFFSDRLKNLAGWWAAGTW